MASPKSVFVSPGLGTCQILSIAFDIQRMEYQQYITQVERASPHTVSRPSTLIQITTITRTFHEHYLKGITCPRILPRPIPVLIQRKAGPPVNRPSLFLSIHIHYCTIIHILALCTHHILSTIFSLLKFGQYL